MREECHMGFEKDVQEQDKNLEKISEMLSDALSLLILLEIQLVTIL